MKQIASVIQFKGGGYLKLRRVGLFKTFFVLASFFTLLFFQNCSLRRQMIPLELSSLSTITSVPLGAVRVSLNADELNRSDAFKNVGMRRLNRFELSNTLNDIFAISAQGQTSLLPEDVIDENLNPFDNDVSQQSVSSSVIESFESFSQAYVALVPDSKIQSLAGCSPTQPADYNCFNQFASKIGRRLLRRPITQTELTSYRVLIDRAVAENNFYLAPKLLLQVFLQHPEFLYRIEVGSVIAGSNSRKLNDFEIANRLSYTIWASAPDDLLLQAAETGQLSDATKRLQQLNRLLNDTKAKRQTNRFHELWLGYESSQLPSNLSADMYSETDQLIEKISGVNSNFNWLDIFSHDQSYLSPKLAAHYGYSAISANAWVTYPTGRGGGVLAHARFASQGSKFGDTSPTLRGYRILKRVLCQKLGSVPVGVDPDNPPVASVGQCKTSSYNMRTQANCTSCHSQTDNIGFGLENLSATGQWRLAEVNKPNCIIDGQGYVGIDAFKGPEELGKNLSQNSVAEQCAIRQLVRYTFGRADTLQDQNLIETLHYEFLQSKKLNSLITAIVKSPSFIHK